MPPRVPCDASGAGNDRQISLRDVPYIGFWSAPMINLTPSQIGLAIALAWAWTGTSQATAFKCVDRGGAVTYQQQPCPAEGPPADSAKDSTPALVPANRLAVGMSAAEVKRLRGPPDRVLSTEREGPDRTEEWIYSNARRGNQAVAITIQHGLVVRWKQLGSDAAASRP